MPPHVESAHNQNEWQHPRSKSTGDINNSQIDALCGCLESPLFRDEEYQPIRPLSQLDRRQSNPDLTSADSQELVTIETGNGTAPFVSKIESIIGPESRYYNTAPAVAADQQTSPSAVAAAPQASMPQKAVVRKTSNVIAAAPAQTTQVQVQTPCATTQCNTSKNQKPLLSRLTHAMSKKSWKLVRYIGEKGKRFMSMMVRSVDPTVGAYEA